MSDVFDLKARVSADATPFNKAMDSSATSVSSALSAINRAASVFIGNGVVRAFSRATETAYEFGQVMADISSISDVSIQQLSRSIKQLDNVYGSMSNVGNSIYNIISSGFDRSEDELLSIIKNIGQASKSIRADLYNTANVFTTVANAYDLSANRFKDIADLLFVTVKEGKAEGNELARTLGLVVNTASEAGLSFAEMSAVISTLSRTQTTSQAMIGFNQMLNAMIKPSKEAADTAKEFGIEFGAAALKSKGFTAIIKDMHDKLQGNVEAINKISGPIRAMRAVVSLTGKQYENFINILEKAEDQIGTGVAMEAFAKQTNTAKQALEKLKVQIDKTFVGVGQDIEPITRHLAEFSEMFLKTFGEGEGWSLGGVGRVGAYISGIGLTIKGVVSSVKLLKNFSTSMVRDGSSLVSSSNTFATNVERAQRSLQLSAAAIADINTLMSAAALPNQHRMEQRALHPSPSMIKRQAQANIDAMYLRNQKGALYDPATGRLVSERKLLAEEIARLTEAYKLERKAILSQVRKDAAVQRYNRRFGTDYTSYDDIKGTGKLRRGWKVLGASVSKGLTALGTGLLNVSMMVAAWETGWSIGKAIGEKLKLADWELTQWIADIIEGKLPGSTSDKEKEIEQANLEILKKTTRARADRLLNEGKLTEAEHAAIANEIRLAQATNELAKVRNRLARKEEPKEEPKPVKGQKQVEEENKKNREVTVEEARKGKYKANATLGDNIEKTIKGYKIPAALQQELLKHYTSENWSTDIKDFGVSKLDHRTKTSMLHQALKVREYKNKEGRPMLPAAADSQREFERVEAHSNTALLNEIITNYFKHQSSRIIPRLKQMREQDAKATYDKRLKQAKYDSTLSGFKNTIQNEFNRFTNEGVGTVDHAKHRRIRVGEYTLDQEPVGEIEDNKSAFDAKARNYADRVAEFNKRSEYVRKQQVAMRGAGMSDKHIAESLSSHTSTLDTMKASLETERKALSELARQQVELPSEFVASYKSSAAHRGEDINSESFLTGLRRRLESQAALTRIAGFKETAAQEDVRVRQLGAYYDESEKANDAIIKNREALRRDKVAAGSMTEVAAAYESIEDIRATLARLKRQNRTFGQYAEDSDLSSRTRLYYANKVKANNIKLEKVGIQLTEAFKRLGEATDKVRSGMLNAIQSFASAENRLSISQLQDLGGRWTHGAAGRMNNNALWHSVNLAARMGGMVRSRPYMVSVSEPQKRGQAFRARKQAQGAISASVDAWIMSQKYAQANVGKTVTDIYTFMKQNNTIVVRNK